MSDIVVSSRYREIKSIFYSPSGSYWGLPHKCTTNPCEDDRADWLYFGRVSGEATKSLTHDNSFIAWVESVGAMPNNNEYKNLEDYSSIPDKIPIVHAYRKFSTLSNRLGLPRFAILLNTLHHYGNTINGDAIPEPVVIRFLINSNLIIPLRCLEPDPIMHDVLDYSYKVNFHIQKVVETYANQRRMMYKKLVEILTIFDTTEPTMGNVYEHDFLRSKKIRDELEDSVDEMVDKLSPEELNSGVVGEIYNAMVDDLLELENAIGAAELKFEGYVVPVQRKVVTPKAKKPDVKKPDLSVDGMANALASMLE